MSCEKEMRGVLITHAASVCVCVCVSVSHQLSQHENRIFQILIREQVSQMTDGLR